MTIQHQFGLSNIFLQRCGLDKAASFVAGAELEIEAVQDYSGSYLEDNGIVVETDGSLRNNGKEFLLPPNYRNDLVDLFRGLHGCIDLGNDPFSQRTSTHIHVNMMNSTENQTRALLFLYAIFEPLAFAYVGEERKNNIHCMPLYSTHMPNYYGNSLENLVGDGKWHKYTAFNLLPLRELGTVEFRHLGGTDDPERFAAWLDFIKTLWDNAHKVGQVTKAHLMDIQWLRDIQAQLLTKAFTDNCLERPQFILEDNLLDVKLAFI